jgi:hypothetical protein
VVDGNGKPLMLQLMHGRTSDHKDARTMLDVLPSASTLIAD